MVRRVLGQWTDPERVAEYLSREIPHRDIAESLLLEALPQRVGLVLDLGTGDGRLLALVCSRHTGAQAVGIDSSQPMLARAAERFGSCTTVELGVHDLNQPLAVSVPFDVVVSGLAIHHLSDERPNARSGRPGRSPRLHRQPRTPAAHRARRSASAGAVLLGPIDIRTHWRRITQPDVCRCPPTMV
jgi:SAM-dependent methyltransferase